MMKKIKLLAMMLMAASISMTTVSCGSDGDDGDAPGQNDSEVSGGGSSNADALNSNDAKKKLEQYARELISKVNSNDFINFQTITDAARNSDDQVISDWLDACLEACESQVSDTYLKRVYAAANFTGEFVLSNGRWTQTQKGGDHLRISLTDTNGNPCVLTVTTSGSTTQVHHEAFDDEEYAGYWNGYSHYQTIANSFVIPEHINITLTQGGSTPLTAEVHTAITQGSGDFDPSRDEAQVTATVTANDWKVLVNKAAFHAGKSAEATARVVKGSETLFEASASATGAVTNDEASISTGKVVARVLGGKVRVEGTIKDGFQHAMEQADKNDEKENSYKQWITNANALMDVKLYLDDSKNASASLVLLPFVDRYSSPYYSYEYWYNEPGLLFTDGTSYTFSEYFDDGSFKTVIKNFENLMDSFARMFGDD